VSEPQRLPVSSLQKITNHYDLMVVIKARFFLVVRLFVGVRTLTANLRVRIFGKLDI
jgi:hypothetical protein